MKLLQVVGMFLIGSAVLAGCGKPASTTPSAGPAVNSSEPTQAQPRLQTLKVWVGAESLATELALSGEQQRTGMMFRKSLPENEAMLFIFPWPHRASFYMKNTTVPLSAAYINPSGVILEIHDLQPLNTNSVVAASDDIQFVLETAQGWFARHNINTGVVVRTEIGNLSDSFSFRPR